MAVHLEKGDRRFLQVKYERKHGGIKKKGILIILSTMLALFNLGLFTNDMIQLDIQHQPESSSHSYILPVLISNIIGFYFGLLSFVYGVITKHSKPKYLAASATILNVLAFMLRLLFEISYLDYRPEKYGTD